MNQNDLGASFLFLGATLGMVASTTPERWARAPGPWPLEKVTTPNGLGPQPNSRTQEKIHA